MLRNQRSQLRRSLGTLRREGFHRNWVLHGVDEIEDAIIERVPLWTDRRGDQGPFDIIGDIHGCYDELTELLARLGYRVDPDGTDAAHPDGRRAFFVGDLVDRGPATPTVLRLAMGMVASGHAVAVPGTTSTSSPEPSRAPTSPPVTDWLRPSASSKPNRRSSPSRSSRSSTV